MMSKVELIITVGYLLAKVPAAPGAALAIVKLFNSVGSLPLKKKKKKT